MVKARSLVGCLLCVSSVVPLRPAAATGGEVYMTVYVFDEGREVCWYSDSAEGCEECFWVDLVESFLPVQQNRVEGWSRGLCCFNESASAA